MKSKIKYHTVGACSLKSNRNFIDEGKVKTPYTQILIHDHSLSWLGTATAIQSDGIKPVLWAQNSILRLSKNWQYLQLLFPVFKMLCFNITLRLAELVFCGLTQYAVNYWCPIYIYMVVFIIIIFFLFLLSFYPHRGRGRMVVVHV